MAVPSLSASLDASNYSPGALITLTLTVTDPDRGTLSVTATYVDSTGSPTTVTANAEIDQGTFSVTSSPPKVWTKVSESNGTAVFTATA